MLWLESSLTEFYDSAVAAFPNTAMRQHATNTIKISKIEWVPFIGMKTLFVKGLAQNEGNEYNPIIVFKKVAYHENEANSISLHANDGETYYLEQLSISDTDVLVRCNCPDFNWRFQHFNKIDKSLQGSDRKKYEALYRPDSANPTHSPGICKHIMKFTKALAESSILKN